MYSTYLIIEISAIALVAILFVPVAKAVLRKLNSRMIHFERSEVDRDGSIHAALKGRVYWGKTPYAETIRTLIYRVFNLQIRFARPTWTTARHELKILVPTGRERKLARVPTREGRPGIEPKEKDGFHVE